ncbi:uncharacterized protein [Nicotiana sylvestris]|uniref:uncharacterized protein n=1 Tax=Nicotiana sylvestris TaxID=4096 RepID=UPI00388C8187
MNTPYAEACEILDEMTDTSSAWQNLANVPQGDPTVIHLHKELHDHGQYVNNYQGQRGNAPNQQQQWRSQGNWGNQNQQGNSNWGNNNQNWGNQNNQGNWSGNNNNWGVNNNQGGWNNRNQGNRGQGFQRPPMYQQPNNSPPFPFLGPSSSNNEMGRIEMMFEQIMKNNADSDVQLASHNTSIRNLEVQLGQILQSLITRPKGDLPNDRVVNLKGRNNTGHAMAVITRSSRGGDVNTSKQKEVVSDEVEVHDDDVSIVDEQVSEENLNVEVRIDIHDNDVEIQDDVNPSREHVIDISKMVVPKAKAPLTRPPLPYPQRLTKQKNENQFKKFIEMMKNLSINVPSVEALEQMPGYANFIKDLVIKKRSMNCETIKMTHQVSAIVHSMAPKLEDPDAFTIPCTIGSADFAKALCDLGASINLMTYFVLKTFGISQPRATSMRLQMADKIMKRPLGIIDDVLVRVDKFILPADFVILDCEVDYEVPIILGRPFLATGKVLVDMEAGELTFRVGDEKVIFHVCKSMRQPNSTKVCSFVDLVTEVIVDDPSAMINVEDHLEAVLLNLDVNEDEGWVECVNSLHGIGCYSYEPHKLSLDLENRKTPPTKPSIEEPPILELKPLPSHRMYEFLGPSRCNTGGDPKKEEGNWMDSS